MQVRVHFHQESSRREAVAAAFAAHRQRLGELLPGAEIHHIGSTAVPGSLTKGDLDINVRVPFAEFVSAASVLAASYPANAESSRSATFLSFADEGASPPLGIQLTAIGGPEDFFCLLRDHLQSHPAINEEYNDLKRRCEGADMEDYRRAKSLFLEALLASLRPGTRD